MRRIFIIAFLFFTWKTAFPFQYPVFSTQPALAGDTLKLPLKTPTVFTPNYDGVNDIFTFETSGALKVNCKIYNRWGVKVYEWDGKEGSWDGRTSAGNACPGGVYYFVVLVTDSNGIVHEEKGFTHLVR